MTGIAELESTVAWFKEANLSYTHVVFSYYLADAYLRKGAPAKARAVLEAGLGKIRGASYRQAEGWGERLLGESLISEDPAAAATHLATAAAILEEIGARNELAKTLAAQGALRRAAGDVAGAKELFERALGIFEELGTIDEPPRVRAALAALIPKTPE